jgi:hypothetical protein
MKPIRVPILSPERLAALEELYRTPKARLRTRAQMLLLAAERGLTASEIAQIVPQSQETVRRWLKRYLAEGESRACAMRPIRARRARLRRSTASGWWRRYVAVRGALGCRSLWGRCTLWPTTWPSRPASGSSTRPFGCT